MMNLSHILALILLVKIGYIINDNPLNNRPIIAVLEQRFGSKPTAFIAAPYVKLLEMAGARVVPIELNKEKQYYCGIVKETNGLLFPGGGRDIMNSSFRDAAEMLFDCAMDANDRDEYYPIWGECQGLQIITVLIVEKYLHNPNHSDNWLTNCKAKDMALNLDFKIDPKNTQIFANADANIINILKRENVTPNYHQLCMTPKNFSESNLKDYLRIVTTSRDADGLEFISTFESTNKSRPIYGLQWHPEKSVFEFSVVNKSQEPDGPQENIPHNYNAILISQFMANYFVNETRKNNHSFGSETKENEVIIYNYNPEFSLNGAEDEGEHFSQIYIFNTNSAQNKYQSNGLLVIGIIFYLAGIVTPLNLY